MRITSVRTSRSAHRIAGLLIGASCVGSPAGLSSAAAQEDVRLAGVVADERTWTPVASARVTIVGTDIEVLSRDNGTFELPQAPLGPLTVKVEAPGFATMVEEVEVREDAVVFLQFALPSMAAFLDEIFVTGRRSDPSPLTEARTAADLLVGKLPGVGSNSGIVGVTVQPVLLRGVSSFMIQGEPALFLDGVRMAGAFRDALRTLEQIPVSDVRDIQILRGPAAAFLQGSADGAILIRTKNGRRN